MTYYIQYIFVRFVAFLISLFPIGLAVWVGRTAGNFIFFVFKRRRKIAIANIDKALSQTVSMADKRRIARAAFQNMAISLIELFLIKKIKGKTSDNFIILGNEYIDDAFAKGKGVVLVISHLGSWEYLSFLPYLTKKDWSVVVKDIRNPYLNEYIKRLRSLTTVVPIEKKKSMRPILKELKQNHGVAILIDQWAGAEGLWLDFFNSKTSTTSIPARLAKKTGCALIPAYCLRQGLGKYEIHIHPPVSINPEETNWEETTTIRLNELLEEQIRKYPEQWLWGHRRWKKNPLTP